MLMRLYGNAFAKVVQLAFTNTEGAHSFTFHKKTKIQTSNKSASSIQDTFILSEIVNAGRMIQ